MTPYLLDHGLSMAALSGLFGHFLLLSMLAIGGAITTTPDMHRYLVAEQHWMTDGQFTASIALAQAAPGPNLLFVAVLGWGVGGALGMLATMVGILLPSTTLALAAARWGQARRETRGVRAFTQGMAPVTVGLLLSTGWVLTAPVRHQPTALLLVAATVVVMLRTRISPIWLIVAGAGAGAALL
jgi:chromate transporter